MPSLGAIFRLFSLILFNFMAASKTWSAHDWQNDWPQAMVQALALGYLVTSIELLTRAGDCATPDPGDTNTEISNREKEKRWRSSG
jgi:hypothetical protein